MPERILLQCKIPGMEEFLLAASAEGRCARFVGEDLLAGRSQWTTLLCEVLPPRPWPILASRAFCWVRRAAVGTRSLFRRPCIGAVKFFGIANQRYRATVRMGGRESIYPEPVTGLAIVYRFEAALAVCSLERHCAALSGFPHSR